MATLGSLISKRGGNRGVVTRLLRRINNIMSDQAMERDRKIHELNKKLQKLHDKIKVLETLDSEIVQLLTEEEMATEITNADTINALSYDTRDEAEYVLSTLMAEKKRQKQQPLTSP
ncbi:hypothetical protein GHT06_015183 [Daphnia sinensis]|uniref:Uncharacterized protein n=1 Tax=Daphnia sinensis TaxID=1820382 RepID=A0AAD5PUF3_9CRUS|nr:hypothetical protein GHT06_015183 [Daphnia sinensis]